MSDHNEASQIVNLRSGANPNDPAYQPENQGRTGLRHVEPERTKQSPATYAPPPRNAKAEYPPPSGLGNNYDLRNQPGGAHYFQPRGDNHSSKKMN